MESDSTAEFDASDALIVPDDRFRPENVCLVTGAASGIGRATAAVLAANGLTVVGADVDRDGLDATADLAAGLDGPGSVEPVETDLTDDGDVEALVEAAADRGALRYVANIAGMQRVAPIEEFPMDAYDRMHAVMVRAPLLLVKRAWPHLREPAGGSEDGFGVVGNMCSIHGHVATQDKSAYITSKFGLRGLTKSIAAEGEGSIRSFTVSTSYVETPLVTDQIPDTAEQRGISEEAVVEDVMLGGSRVKEMMTPVEVGNLFAFAFSRHGKHLNGGDLPWDGGHLSTYE